MIPIISPVARPLPPPPLVLDSRTLPDDPLPVAVAAGCPVVAVLPVVAFPVEVFCVVCTASRVNPFEAQ